MMKTEEATTHTHTKAHAVPADGAIISVKPAEVNLHILQDWEAEW
jgi:hypothetical protein